MTLPLQNRFLPLSKIVDWHFWYHRNGEGVTWACERSGLPLAASAQVDMGKDAWAVLDDLRRNDPAGLEKKIREKLAESRFTSLQDAEQVVKVLGKITQLKRGKWRALININGVKVVCYNESMEKAVADAAQQLLNEFPGT